jgi:hypothetical protein
MSAAITEQTVHPLEIVKAEEITAPIDVVFETILEPMGLGNEEPGTGPIPTKLEAAGGAMVSRSRQQRGTLQGPHAADQSRQPCSRSAEPSLSYPALSNVQCRLAEEDGITRLRFTNKATEQISRSPQI